MRNGKLASILHLSKDVDLGEYCHEQGWSDGLPVTPPTPERVSAMLSTGQRDPSEVLGVFLPVGAEVTVEKVAINAVLAGCLPAYFPVVLAAVECMAEREGSLGGLLTTIHGDTPLLIMNGPEIKRLGFNSGANTFGPGWRANATVGRAIALLMRNVAAGEPGQFDMATQTHPGKYTFCIAEFEEASPWPSLSVERGLSVDENAVTVVGAQGPRHVVDMASTTAKGILNTIADSMAIIGTYNIYRGGETIIVLSPTHARIIAGEGWSKDDVKYYLWEKARKPLGQLKQGGYFNVGGLLYWPKWVDIENDDYMVPVAFQPQDILVVVAGGEVGGYSSIIFGFGMRSTTRAILPAMATVDGQVRNQTQNGGEFSLLNPKYEHQVKDSPLATRLDSLNGTAIAIVNAVRDPKRSSGDILSQRVGEILLREGVGQILPLRKEEPSDDMPQETLDYLVSQAQGAIILEGD